MSKTKTGTVFLVGAGPGDPGLLTLRAAELLGRADVVIHDVLVNPALLRHARTGAEIIDAAKVASDRTLRQETLNRLLVEHAKAGRTVVRLKGGDPYVFGRGGEEAEDLARHGIPFEVVPGVSSFSAVPAYAGIPLTHRNCASAFTVVTGHEDPARGEAAVNWAEVARLHGTKVVLMGVERLDRISASLIEAGQPASTPVALIRNGTLGSQQTLEGVLGDIAAKSAAVGFQSPAVAVIGEVVKLRSELAWFEARPLFGKRIVVTRAREQAGEFAGRLAELGAEVLEIPTIRTSHPTEREPMIEALAGLGEYDWIVFTSVNGVNAFLDGLLAAFEDVRSLGNLRIAAVGSATAARIREYRLRVDAQPADFVGRAVADAIGKTESLENLRVLLARAEVGNPDVSRELEANGAIVDDVSFYRTVPETEIAEPLVASLREKGADWITFTSSSTVTHLNARVPLKDLVLRHPTLRVASIGPETTRTLANLGVKPTVEANPHNLDGLIKAMLGPAGDAQRFGVARP
jgi:uroporphyrinogen III methyltransferase/synthase